MYYYAEYYHKRKNEPQVKERTNRNANKYYKKKFAERRANGLCIKCGKPVCEQSVALCDYHRLLHNKQHLERYHATHVYKTEEEMKAIKAEATKRIKEGFARWVEEKRRKKAEQKKMKKW
jgi:hypothetical protein